MCEPTFQTLRQVLLDLGFHMKSVPDSHVRFDNQTADTIIVLPLFKEEETIDKANVIGIRRLLDEKGVIDRDAFDEMLRERSLTG